MPDEVVFTIRANMDVRKILNWYDEKSIGAGIDFSVKSIPAEKK